MRPPVTSASRRPFLLRFVEDDPENNLGRLTVGERPRPPKQPIEDEPPKEPTRPTPYGD